MPSGPTLQLYLIIWKIIILDIFSLVTKIGPNLGVQKRSESENKTASRSHLYLIVPWELSLYSKYLMKKIRGQYSLSILTRGMPLEPYSPYPLRWEDSKSKKSASHHLIYVKIDKNIDPWCLPVLLCNFIWSSGKLSTLLWFWILSS